MSINAQRAALSSNDVRHTFRSVNGLHAMEEPAAHDTAVADAMPDVSVVALNILDERGADELTMRVLAEALGVATSTLHARVGGKAALDGTLVARILAVSALSDASWRAGLERLADEAEAVRVRHPNATALLRAHVDIVAETYRRAVTDVFTTAQLSPEQRATAIAGSTAILVGCVIGVSNEASSTSCRQQVTALLDGVLVGELRDSVGHEAPAEPARPTAHRSGIRGSSWHRVSR